MTEVAVYEIEPISVRFDGLDATGHFIDASQMGDSLKGLARIAATAATFAISEKVIHHQDARPVRVVVGPAADNCITFKLAFLFVENHPFLVGTTSTLTASLITYIFKYFSGRAEEMKHLRGALDTAIRELGNRDEAVVNRLLDTVDRMAESLKPSVKLAVKPVGVSADTMTIGNSSAPRAVIDAAQRSSIDAQAPIEVADEVEIAFQFAEMNLDGRSCRVRHVGDDDDARTPAEITDPEFLIPDNAYARAFAAQTSLTVRAKATVRDGQIERWYISAHR